MKKGLKIALISLGSLIGLVLLVVLLVCYLVFTPSRLTSIVNKVADKVLLCDAEFESVDLTLLSTFPDAGLKIKNVLVINPFDGAQSDTLAAIGSLTVGLDVKAYLQDKNIIVHQVELKDVLANLYTDSCGNSNFNIFNSSDTTEDDNDTSSFSMPNILDIKSVEFSNLNLNFNSEAQNILASLSNIALSLKGQLKEEKINAKLKLNFDIDTLQMLDSLGSTTLATHLNDVALKLSVAGDLDTASGKLNLSVPKGKVSLSGTEYVTNTLYTSDKDLLQAELPFALKYNDFIVGIDDATLSLDDYKFFISGLLNLPKDDRPLSTDLALSTSTLHIKPLLDILPPAFTSWRKGMSVDGDAKLEATVVGEVTDSTMPIINAFVSFADGKFSYPKALPYKLDHIGADLAAYVDLSKGGVSSVDIKKLKAHTRSTNVSVTGHVSDLMGNMHIDARIKGSAPFADLEPLLPDSLPLAASCDIDIDVALNSYLSQLTDVDLEHINASGMVKIKNLDAVYDSITAQSPNLDIALNLPAKNNKDKVASAHLTSSNLKVQMPQSGLSVGLNNADIDLNINNILKQQAAPYIALKTGEVEGQYDSIMFSLGGINLSGSARLDSTQTNILRKFNPNLDIDLHSVVAYSPDLPDAVRMPQFQFNYSPEVCNIKSLDLRVGMSEFQLYGEVFNLEEWLSHEAMLKGDLNFVSDYADVDQLMSLVSGLGSDPDTLESQREEDKVDKEANPFIVPRDVNLTLNTHVKRAIAFGNDLSDVAGSLTINDGTAILDQMGFVCKAATMQLTAIYRSPRPNNLFVALDFHLLDIQIDELLKMIPTVDTLVPMLAAFKGNANFHLAGESYLFANYKPKMSTLLGSAAINGKNLVVFDNETLSQVAKLMQLKSWKEKDNTIHVDSISVELTCFRKEIEVFPFVVSIGNYSFCAAGKHNLDNFGNYHLELLKNPLLARVAVDVNGPLSKPQIKLGSIQYADLYKPEKQGAAEAQAMKMKAMVRSALEANVR